jgi:hypothetical protein
MLEARDYENIKIINEKIYSEKLTNPKLNKKNRFMELINQLDFETDLKKMSHTSILNYFEHYERGIIFRFLSL